MTEAYPRVVCGALSDEFGRVLPLLPWPHKTSRTASRIERGKAEGADEIPFNRYFYQYSPPRDLKEIDAELDALSAEIMEMLREVHS